MQWGCPCLPQGNLVSSSLHESSQGLYDWACIICPLRSQCFLTARRRVLLQAFTHLHPPHAPSSMQCGFLARRPVISSLCPVHHLGWVAQATKAIVLQCPLPVCTEVCHILQINPPVSPCSLIPPLGTRSSCTDRLNRDVTEEEWMVNMPCNAAVPWTLLCKAANERDHTLQYLLLLKHFN